MRILLLITTIFYFNLNANNYTFLVEKNYKELELEAKIISKIVYATLKNKEKKVFIPNSSEKEKEIYSKFLNIVKSCENSNFIFFKNKSELKKSCDFKEKVLFTDNYQLLLKEKEFVGSFFWSKGRPNITFIKDRLIEKDIILPPSFNQFVEDF